MGVFPQFPPRTIHLSSKYASQYYDNQKTKCGFTLSRPITVPSEFELHVALLSACIPFSFYSVPQTTLTYLIGAVSTPWITIPAGNWSTTDLVNLLTITNITVTFTTQTGLFTFRNNNAGTITLPASTLLGTLTPKVLATNASTTSDIIPDIAGTRFINIVSSLTTDCITAGTTPSGSGQLMSIPVNASPSQFIIYQPNNLVQNRLKETNINSIDITLCDSNMNTLNMNGSDWEIDLLITVLEEEETRHVSQDEDLFSSIAKYNPKKIRRV